MNTAYRARSAALLVALLVAISLLPLTPAAQAQTTYRWIDKSGQTVFSDQPPPPGTRLVAEQKPPAEPPDDTGMPYDVRVAAQKHPVLYYTTTHCKDVCQRGRELLTARGIPFTEKTVASPEEADALGKELGFELAIPTLTVGRQRLEGFEAGAWNDLLDIAGYPKSASYRKPAPRPATAQ